MSDATAVMAHSHVSGSWPPAGAWVRACVAAEAIGITAAAAASVVAEAMTTGPAARLGVVVAGGLVEGAALGVLQARALGSDASPQQRRRWLLVTVLVAGVGWAAGSLPAALQEDGSEAGPGLLVVLPGAAALGAAMGTLIGVVQAPVLRGLVRRPWRWVVVSAVAWAPAMTVIFAGASLPSSAWPRGAILLMGPPTGLLAGLALGVVSVQLARVLDVQGS